jgi:hypothetical protein
MKISVKAIGIIGLFMLLFGCFVACTVCVVFAIATATGLDVPTSASYSADSPVPSLGTLDCPLLLSRNEPVTVVVSISNPSKFSQPIDLSISGNVVSPALIESDAIVTLAPLENIEKKWNFTIENLGIHLIWVRMNDLDDPSQPSFYYDTYCTIGVVETFGLTANQFEAVGVISIIIGSILVGIWFHTRRRSKKTFSQ